MQSIHTREEYHYYSTAKGYSKRDQSTLLVNVCNKYTRDMAKMIHFLHLKCHHVIVCGNANEQK